jgi:hypothetical protein
MAAYSWNATEGRGACGEPGAVLVGWLLKWFQPADQWPNSLVVSSFEAPDRSSRERKGRTFRIPFSEAVHVIVITVTTSQPPYL